MILLLKIVGRKHQQWPDYNPKYLHINSKLKNDESTPENNIALTNSVARTTIFSCER